MAYNRWLITQIIKILQKISLGSFASTLRNYLKKVDLKFFHIYYHHQFDLIETSLHAFRFSTSSEMKYCCYTQWGAKFENCGRQNMCTVWYKKARIMKAKRFMRGWERIRRKRKLNLKREKYDKKIKWNKRKTFLYKSMVRELDKWVKVHSFLSESTNEIKITNKFKKKTATYRIKHKFRD